MNIFLLRHGIAADRATGERPRDSDRPLIPEGKRKVRQVATAMETLKVSFDFIISSPYVRARQTAEIVAGHVHARKKLQFSETLTPPGTCKEVIQFLKSLSPTPESVLLVGHEPNLSELISFLLSGDRSLSLVMRKGGLCKLTVESLVTDRCATLEWLLTPKQMALIAN